MADLGSFEGVAQPDPEVGAKRVRVCKWSVSTEWKVPEGAVSGGTGPGAQPDPGGLTSLILQIRDDDVSIRTP